MMAFQSDAEEHVSKDRELQQSAASGATAMACIDSESSDVQVEGICGIQGHAFVSTSSLTDNARPKSSTSSTYAPLAQTEAQSFAGFFDMCSEFGDDEAKSVGCKGPGLVTDEFDIFTECGSPRVADELAKPPHVATVMRQMTTLRQVASTSARTEQVKVSPECDADGKVVTAEALQRILHGPVKVEVPMAVSLLTVAKPDTDEVSACSRANIVSGGDTAAQICAEHIGTGAASICLSTSTRPLLVEAARATESQPGCKLSALPPCPVTKRTSVASVSKGEETVLAELGASAGGEQRARVTSMEAARSSFNQLWPRPTHQLSAVRKTIVS